MRVGVFVYEYVCVCCEGEVVLCMSETGWGNSYEHV